MTYNDLFEAELLKLVGGRIDFMVDSISNNASVSTIENYRYRAGQIDALREIKDLCDEANRVLAER